VTVGVPLIWPLLVLKLRPVGNVDGASAYRTVPLKLDADRLELRSDTPMVPLTVCEEGLKVAAIAVPVRPNSSRA